MNALVVIASEVALPVSSHKLVYTYYTPDASKVIDKDVQVKTESPSMTASYQATLLPSLPPELRLSLIGASPASCGLTFFYRRLSRKIAWEF
ncbi:MAG: hypothetical protein Q8M20_03140 [Rhodocyclaceae bacterium]|nr:hypothetical protein [Rhodocyclaceae bacterium]MDZ4213376.1 hypothetical protein [Rhodocyclaceae bacterium]